MDVCKVVKVKPWGKDQGAFVEINAEDFDAKVHKLVEDIAALADPLNIPSASEEAVAEAAKPASAEKPVPKPRIPRRKKGAK